MERRNFTNNKRPAAALRAEERINRLYANFSHDQNKHAMEK